MSHTVVGSLLLGHTARDELVDGWGRQVIIRTTRGCQPVEGSDPTHDRLAGGCWLGEVLVDLAGHVAFEAADDFAGGAALGSSAGHVAASLLVIAHSGDDDPVERRVGVAVASVVQSVPGDLPLAGMGATPHRWAQAVSERSRSG